MFYIFTDTNQTVNMPFLVSEVQKEIGNFNPLATNTQNGEVWIKDMIDGDMWVSSQKEDDEDGWSLLRLTTVEQLLHIEKINLAETLERVQKLEVIV